jgi:hypothetical protein
MPARRGLLARFAAALGILAGVGLASSDVACRNRRATTGMAAEPVPKTKGIMVESNKVSMGNRASTTSPGGKR